MGPSGWAEVVGIVGNVKTFSESTGEDPAIFESYLQRPIPSFFLMVRTTTDANALISTMRNEIAKVDPELPLAQLQSMQTMLGKQNTEPNWNGGWRHGNKGLVLQDGLRAAGTRPLMDSALPTDDR